MTWPGRRVAAPRSWGNSYTWQQMAGCWLLAPGDLRMMGASVCIHVCSIYMGLKRGASGGQGEKGCVCWTASPCLDGQVSHVVAGYNVRK